MLIASCCWCKLRTMGIGYIPAPVRKVAAIADSDGQADLSGRKPRKGRPRSEEAERAILQAAAEVLATRGLSGMSIEDVASRAGVGQATIYPRWSSKGALARDTFLPATTQHVRPP